MTPQLIALAQQHGLPKGCQVFQVRYRYGDHIIQNGVFHLPNEDGELVPINHPSIPKELREKLPETPIWTSLEKQVEIYLTSGDRVVPIDIQNPGEFFLREPAPWNVCAGARTIFSTAKVSEKRRHQHLNKHYKLNTAPPVKLTDQFSIFKAIAQSDEVQNPWYCDVLIFSKDWFSDSAEVSSMVLKTYFQQEQLKKQSLAQLNTLRNCAFSKIESTLNLKLNQNTVNYARHILGMSDGSELGLSFEASENFFPKALLEKAYIKHYKLEYAPIFMTLSRESQNQYFSFNAPINSDLNTKIRDSTSRIEELRDVSRVIKKMKEWIPQSKQVAFFHTYEDPSDDIQAIEQLTQQDIVLTKELERFPGKGFCVHSLLLKGLVSVSH